MKKFSVAFAFAFLLGITVAIPAFAGAMSWKAHDDGIWKIKFSPEGTFFLTAGGDGFVKMWWTDCLCPLTKFKHDSDFKIYDAEFLSEGRVISTSHDGTTRVWFRETGELLKKIEDHSEYVVRVRPSFDGSRFYALGTDDHIRAYDAKTYELLSDIKTRSPVGAIPFGANSEKLMSVGLEGIQFWNFKEKTLEKQISKSPYFFTTEPIDESHAVVGGNPKEGGPLQIINLATGEIEKLLEQRDGFFWQIAVSPNREWIAGSAFRGQTFVWDIKTGKVIYETPTNLGKTISTAFFPEGRAMLIGTEDGMAKVVRF